MSADGRSAGDTESLSCAETLRFFCDTLSFFMIPTNPTPSKTKQGLQSLIAAPVRLTDGGVLLSDSPLKLLCSDLLGSASAGSTRHWRGR